MSHTAQQNGAAAPGEEDAICPVCKSSRYLNPKMRFLLNPECYHKMCESCVDRIFSQGPAPCPVAGCGKTLRKARFKKQTFEDVKVEREVDIRRRVASIFNRREEEFNRLLDFNNYLELVEVLIFNLIDNTDVAATEAKIAAYASQNASIIARNAALESKEHLSAEARRAAEKEDARLRREAVRKEEIDEKKERAEGKREIVERFKHGKGDADDILREGQKSILKKSTARQLEKSKLQQKPQVQSHSDDPFGVGNGNGNGPAIGGVDPSGLIQGLKPIEVVEPEKPYDPFGGMEQKRDYYVLQDHYEHSWLDKARTDPVITAGGYDVKEYYSRTMHEAFAGLGCFIADEVAARDALAAKSTPTVAAAIAAGDDDTGMQDAL